MSLQVSFRVVGLYCYFENLEVPNVNETSTVKQVMDEIANLESAFSYDAISLDGKEIVDRISYDFSNGSTVPFNSSGRPANGSRSLNNEIGNPSQVWQYYRSVTGKIDDTVTEVKLLSRGQPSFADTPINFFDSFFGGVPASMDISTYNLTWRLVQIQMSPQSQAKFMQAKVAALQEA